MCLNQDSKLNAEQTIPVLNQLGMTQLHTVRTAFNMHIFIFFSPKTNKSSSIEFNSKTIVFICKYNNLKYFLPNI